MCSPAMKANAAAGPMVEPGPGFDDMIALLIGLVRRLAVEVAAIGHEAATAANDSGWQAAAE